ncbi:hypothetical protein [Ruminiclostridium josui]|uniref:hypothetical protein n=1 Tax=Ruminiclostridium josui TaxID=1499 RepID=UPI0004650C7D|nr:hypothetical protein [Ruminiclostridium josui]
MEILRKNPDKYGIQKVGKNKHRIVKILVECDNEQEALQSLTKLLSGEISEQDLVEGQKGE